MHSADFHAHHSPLGAYASFTCGRHGAGGGLTIAGRKPAQHPLTVGFVRGGVLHQLPFSVRDGVSLDNYAEEVGGVTANDAVVILDGSQRRYAAGTDSWTAGPLRFTIHTPVWPLPDPEREGDGLLQDYLLPAVVCELELDNREGKDDAELVFAMRPGDPVNHLLPAADGQISAVSWQRRFAIASPSDDGATSWVHWDAQEYVREHRSHRLGGLAGLSRVVAAGERACLRIICAFHEPGVVTTGIDSQAWYLRRYPTLQAVINHAAARFSAITERTAAMDRELEQSGLDPHQQFLIAHAQRSYWGNSHLLDDGGRPLWVVYEGEYAMINTFDLTVDQCFYEMRRNPWVVRNVCDQFVNRYSYYDQLNRPPSDAAERAQRVTMCRDPQRLHELVPEPAQRGLPGGISFSHDMGVYPHFMPPGESSYEISHLAGCFSYMTCEQLYNWVCTAVTYARGSGDLDWVQARAAVFKECLISLLNRDDPVPSQRNGLNSLDSDRCAGGWEITTYDSLDHSLGQARNNGYMAVKGWAAALGLEWVMGILGQLKLQVDAADQAQRAAQAVIQRFDATRGYLPAVFEGEHDSAIIPAVEGLIFPLVWDMPQAIASDGPHGQLIACLRSHLGAILRPGMCLFADGGWKLSSSADNSWLSKIFICQHVAERVLGIPVDSASHAAHAQWQQVGSRDWGMSDQCINGVAIGSKYYPRCVTNDLWLVTPSASD